MATRKPVETITHGGMKRVIIPTAEFYQHEGIWTNRMIRGGRSPIPQTIPVLNPGSARLRAEDGDKELGPGGNE